MSKYKLVKKYPDSPELGTIISGESVIFKVKGFKNYPEFWEKIKEENDYQILSFKLNKKLFVIDESVNKWVSEDGKHAIFSEFLKDNKIISVVRLSDNEVFTIGDKVKQSNVIHNNTFTITGFEFDVNNKHLLVIGNGSIKLSKIEKLKIPLFKTEDDVDIFDRNSLISVVDKDTFKIVFSNITFDHLSRNYELSKFIRFSSKEKAEEYILMNKHCLSIKEITSNEIIFGNLGFVDSNLQKRLKELVKTKL